MFKNIEEEKKLQKQRESFVASLGHDLKNPTIAQIRALELLKKGQFGNLSSGQNEIIDMVLDSCKYMKAMLSSLLATYRNEKGVVHLNDEKLSLFELVKDCADEMIYIAKAKGASFSVENNSDKNILGDKILIKRVVMNLLSNGIKYSFNNSIIFIRVYDSENMVCFEFENNSPYISEEKRKTIFARYVTFAESNMALGIGLGLYASKKIIEAHEGEIYVKSFKDNRNIFGFKLPRYVSAEKCPRTVVF